MDYLSDNKNFPGVSPSRMGTLSEKSVLNHRVKASLVFVIRTQWSSVEPTETKEAAQGKSYPVREGRERRKG